MSNSTLSHPPLSFLAKIQIRALRSWVASQDEARRSHDPAVRANYQRQLEYRECNTLNSEAVEAWRHMSKRDLDEQLAKITFVRNDEEVRVTEEEGRYVLSVDGIEKGSLSSDPHITSPARLNAHIDSVKCSVRRNHLTLGGFNAELLKAAVKDSKDEARRFCDVLSGEIQYQVIGADGERCTPDDSIAAYEDRPTMRTVKQLFANYPDATKVVLESMGYFLDKHLPLAERWQHREPAGIYSEVTIHRNFIAPRVAAPAV